MFNVRKIQKQILSLVVLESLVVTGLTATPSFANHKNKVESASKQQLTESVSTGQKLALVEGTVTVRETPVAGEESSEAKAPMTLKQVEKFSSGLGSFGAAGL